MSNENYLIVLTSISDDPDRAAVPLVLANSALAADKEALLWLTLEGAQLAIKGTAENVPTKSFAPIKELLDIFIEAGGKIGICPPCGKTHGVTDDNMIDGASWMGAVALLEETAGRQTFNF